MKPRPMEEDMARIKLVQTRDPVAGRKQEYAAFITGEFLPAMNASGPGVTYAWRFALGPGRSTY
ncbi:MAG: hypothetical protein ACQET7_13245 [Thermodesulfobacteriota bacterium]